jgi:hypothetical protein
VGFKLSELLRARRDVPRDAREFLFGDDWESDPLAYSLYADILAGRVSRADVHDVLEVIRVDPELIEEVKRLMGEHDHHEVVGRIYINLERRTPPANFRSFGKRLVPTFNYFQTAVCLLGDGVLDTNGVLAVARSLVERSGYTPERIGNSLADIARRGHLSTVVATTLREHLREQGLVSRSARRNRRRTSVVWQRLLSWTRREPTVETDGPATPIDYRAVVAEWRPAR